MARLRHPLLLWLLVLLLGLTPSAASAVEPPTTDGPARPAQVRPAPTPALGQAVQSDQPVRVVVELRDEPLATYRGGLGGLAGLEPGRGGKLDFGSAAAQAYRQYLSGKRAEFKRYLARAVPAARVQYEFEAVLNGLAVQLPSGREIELLLGAPGVASVGLDGTYHLLMNRSTPLINAPAAWSALGGQERAGEGIKVGIVDTGIDLDLGSEPHPCFDDTGYSAPAGFPRGDLRYTNNKVIVARVFQPAGSSFDASDQNGHGSHVAGTIACNMNTPAPLLAAGQYLTGVAPRAYLGNYNVFPGTTGSAFSIEIAFAVESAVLDGMDVISMSLGGTPGDPAADFLVKAVNRATDAGVVVVIAAGNSGPSEMTIGSPGVASKVITVGASTNPHFFGVPVSVTTPGWTGPNPMGATTGDDGAAFSTTVGPAEIEDWAALFPTGDEYHRRACDDPSSYTGVDLTGKIALIQRGPRDNPMRPCYFSTKINNAAARGAIAAVIFNDEPGDPVAMAMAEPVTIPAVMVTHEDGLLLQSYIAANPSAAVRIEPTIAEAVTPNGDIIAGFSSRGPTPFDYQIKPDVTAPGVNIYSAFQDNNALGSPDGFAVLQGTSMATPHVSGAAALLRQLHPDWTPLEVKGALATTANRNVWTDPSKTETVDVQTQGGGRIDLAAAINAKALPSLTVINFGRFDIGSGPFQRAQRVYLKDVSGQARTWQLSVNQTGPLTGVSVTVEPQALNLPANGILPFRLTLSAPQNNPPGDAFGYVELVSGADRLHIPYYVRLARPLLAGHTPIAIALGSTVSGNTNSGRNLVSNYTGLIGETTPRYVGREVVYSVTVPDTVDLRVTLNSPNKDQAVFVHSALDEAATIAMGDAPRSPDVAIVGSGEGGVGANHTYYITVDSWLTFGNGSFTLTVEGVAPFPRPLSPADQEVVASLRPTFTWSKVRGATSYTIEVATAPPIDAEGNFRPTDLVLVGSTISERFTAPLDLAPGRQYYWHVAANYAGTRGYWSNWNRPTTTFFTPAE